MTRYADPHRCPDCRGAISQDVASCPTCGLLLRGQTAQRLYATLLSADELLVTLRADSAPTAAPVAVTLAPFDPAPYPVQRRGADPRRGLSAPSVPRILLGLGALCLLVAALVFLAVAWSVLGVGGRTATLVVLTAVAAALAGWLSSRALRAAAESLALVGYGLLTLDVVGAFHAGWFGDLSTAGLTALVGGTLLCTGTAGALLTRRGSTTGLVGAEAVGAIGSGLVAVALAQAEWLPLSWSLALATALVALVAVASWLLDLRVATAGHLVVAGAAWTGLTLLGLDRVQDAADWSGLLVHGRVWVLLTAAAYAAVPALVRQLPRALRVSAAAVAQTLALVAVLAPLHASGVNVQLTVLLAVLVVVAVGAAVLPHPWQLTGALTQTVAGLLVLVDVLLMTAEALSRLSEAADDPWRGAGGDLLPGAAVGVPAAWLLPVAVVVLLGSCWLFVRSVRSVALDDRVAETGAAVVAAATVLAVSLYPAPIWLPLALILTVAVAYAGWWALRPSTSSLVVAAVFAAGAVGLSLHAQGLTELALLVVVALAAAVHLRETGAELAAAAGATSVVALGGAVWTAGAMLDADPSWTALVGLLVVAAVALAAPYAPARAWGAPALVARAGLEVGAAMAALPLLAAGVGSADADTESTWLAVYLTAAGVAVTADSLLRRDRRYLAVPGGLLLALATWVRLWDLGVHQPEAYTLPSALVLVGLGLLRLRRDPEASTLAALAPGLSLALLPSLLWTLVEPPGWRALLLGLACLALVLGGVAVRWTAPVLLGATVGGLLVMRLAAPYLGSTVPRWVLIGCAGALLVTVGATWERRLQEARHLVGYVRALR
jgi:hypothetical protein